MTLDELQIKIEEIIATGIDPATEVMAYSDEYTHKVKDITVEDTIDAFGDSQKEYKGVWIKL